MRTHQDNSLPRLKSNTIFVFGSNVAGRHGKGAAKVAHDNFGAKHGIGIGHTGSSYAIPTKDAKLKVLSLELIAAHASNFCDWVLVNPSLDFFLTRVGCGLAGYQDEQIAPMFARIANAPNVSFPQQWEVLLMQGDTP